MDRMTRLNDVYRRIAQELNAEYVGTEQIVLIEGVITVISMDLIFLECSLIYYSIHRTANARETTFKAVTMATSRSTSPRWAT